MGHLFTEPETPLFAEHQPVWRHSRSVPSFPPETDPFAPPTSGRFLAAAGVAVLAAGSYTVQPGDTLSELATEFGISATDLAAANGIVDLDRIYVGQRLSVPGGSGSAESVTEIGTAIAQNRGDATYHVVKPGESLSVIAKRHGIPAATLATANGIVDPDRVLAGARLRITDAPAAPAPATPSAGSYVVKPGDALSVIAERHGVSVSSLAAANGIADPSRIQAGARLTIPGAWHCPVPGGRFVNDFGVAKPDGRFHEGIDVFAPHGSPVYAPVSGTLEQIEGTRGGLQFWLEGDDGRLYIGSHMAAFGAGGRVQAGELVGQVGDSGNAKGAPPHLHFEMHEDDTPINPYPTLVGSCR